MLEQYYDDVYIAYGRKGAGHASVKSLATELVAAGSLGAHLREGFGSEGVVRSYDKDSVVGGIVRVRPENADAAVKQLVEGVDSVGKLSGSALESAKKAAAISFLNSVNTREGLVDFLALHSEASGIGKYVAEGRREMHNAVCCCLPFRLWSDEPRAVSCATTHHPHPTGRSRLFWRPSRRSRLRTSRWYVLNTTLPFIFTHTRARTPASNTT